MSNLPLEEQDRKKIAAEIFQAGLEAVDPYRAVALYTNKIRSVYRDGNFSKLLIAGFGKAACPMAFALEDNIGDIIDAGVVITKYGHVSVQRSAFGVQKISEKGDKSREINQLLVTRHPSLKIFEAGHPVPDENGVKGTDELIKLLKSADESTLVVCLVSGGGSALLVSPYEGITLDEKQKVTQLLLKSGANIDELNTVRKHISGVKGGRLAEFAYPARIISLLLSDVIGDSLDVIASGPTSPDTTTYSDALKVLRKYGLADKASKSIIETIQKGEKGLIPETPKEGDKTFSDTENIIIGSSRIALNAAKRKAEDSGFHSEIISYELSGEAKDAAEWLADKVRKRGSSESQKNKRPLCLISGGETTVTVRGSGLGGRNMELALVFAKEIDGIGGITFLSAGTDGTDGPTDAAGAIVDGDTIGIAKTAGIDPDEYLNNNDSYNFFRKIEGLFITGPTGTNVMDMQIVLLDQRPVIKHNGSELAG